MGASQIIQCVQGKKVLFVSTKEDTYIRNIQEMEIVKKYAKTYDLVVHGSSSYIKRLFYVYARMVWLLLRNRYEVVFVGFAPQLVFFLYRLFEQKKIFIVTDFFVSFYDTLVFDRKKIKGKGLIGRFTFWTDKYVLQHSDLVISDTKSHGYYFIDEFGVSAEKIVTLYLQADESVYYPRKQVKPAQLENKYLVLYFGSILPLQGVDVILQACHLLQNEASLHFVIIGPVNKATRSELQQQKNITSIPWLAQEDLAEHIAMADLCLAGHFNAEIEKAKRTIAGKTYIYRAMEKPIVLGENEANRELFAEDEGVYYVPMGEPQALADLVIKQARKWTGREGK